MCGIFGYVGQRSAAPILIKGLERLEYRGYDSAGVAIMNGHHKIHLAKKKGKVRELKSLVDRNMPEGTSGLGHTRWATHGAPSDRNAHPHLDGSGNIAIVHNGIIENYAALRSQLEKEGHKFVSETDSEVLSHLVEKHYFKKNNLREALSLALKEAHGSYAVGAMSADEPGTLVAARHDSPLVLGRGKGENFISSDMSAVLEHTKEIIPLENGEIVEIKAGSMRITNAAGKDVRRLPQRVPWTVQDAEKQGYEHFMLKEIFEQPRIVRDLCKRRLRADKVIFEELKISKTALQKIRNIHIVACGTSYHAGMIGRYVIEQLTPHVVSVDTSSEFRYRGPRVGRDSLVIVISQSGETADTLAALREAKKRGAMTIAICNVLGSTMEREADGVIYTYAGPEIAVASTKAYTAQLTTLYLLAFFMNPNPVLMKKFSKISLAMQETLDDYSKDKATWDKSVHLFNARYHEALEEYFKAAPEDKKRAPNGFFLFLGRNINYPSALEGALKLKEIAYISAEGYAAGEMKHGPIALIDENPWVICIAVQSNTYDKMLSNIEEIKARGGIVTAIVTKGDRKVKDAGLYLYIEVAKTDELFSPLVVALPLQLIAYHVAKEFNEDIDQPRNLAKSVTVE